MKKVKRIRIKRINVSKIPGSLSVGGDRCGETASFNYYNGTCRDGAGNTWCWVGAGNCGVFWGVHALFN